MGAGKSIMEDDLDLTSEVFEVILYSVLKCLSKGGSGDTFPKMNDTLSVPPLVYTVGSFVSIN